MSSPSAKQPPHSLEAEQSVLGGLLLNNRAWQELVGKISEDDFYTQDHRTIFRAIGRLLTASKPCDFVTLSEYLRDRGLLDEAGGISYLGTLAADTPSAANIKAYVAIVRERSMMRELIATGQDIAEFGYSPDGRGSEELIAKAEELIYKLRNKTPARSLAMHEVIDVGIAAIEKTRADKAAGGKGGLPFGISWLDKRIGGLQGGDVVVIGARPGMGKSAFANQFCINSARAAHPGFVASLEMYARQLAVRSLAHIARVNNTKLKFGADEEFETALNYVAEAGSLPLWFDFDSYSLSSIVGQITHHVLKHGAKYVVVDHIGLIEVEGSSRMSKSEKIEISSRTLKITAKKLNIPIIVLAQLNRNVERENRPPQLSDLRDCGAIEQDASIVIFLHSETKDGTNPKEISFVMPKNRDGRVGASGNSHVFDGATQTFSSTAPERQDSPPQTGSMFTPDPLSPPP